MKTFALNYVAILLLFFAISACKKDSKKEETKSSSLKMDGVEHDISKGILEYYGGDGSDYNIDLTLFSSGITIHEIIGIPYSVSGIAHRIYFEMYSTGSGRIVTGNYTCNITKKAGTFDFANYILNRDIAVNPGIDQVPIKSVIVNVNQSGTEDELSFSGTDINNKAVFGYYKGNLKL